MKYILCSLLFSFVLLQAHHSFAWGKQGHEIVAEIAMHYLSPAAQQKVRTILGTTTPEQASAWMDSMRADKTYDYMKPWHFINIDKGKSYVPGGNDIMTELLKVYGELLHWKTLPAAQQKTDLCILIHLVGDLHQPLHVGYAVDEGGNKIAVQFIGYPTNLHEVWDKEIIYKEHITTALCLAKKDPKSIPKSGFATSSFALYLAESRALLPKVYAFSNGQITAAYSLQNKDVITLQLLHAGKRLALILGKLLA